MKIIISNKRSFIDDLNSRNLAAVASEAAKEMDRQIMGGVTKNRKKPKRGKGGLG